MIPADLPARGYTPTEVSKLLRCSPDRVRALIRSGELQAVNMGTHRSGRPRFVVLPEHLRAFAAGRRASTVTTPAPRRKRRAVRDYYPD